MSYYIDIIDTETNVVALTYEKASASGIVLKWNGGDNKDELAIVTSELNFDMLSPDATDATFLSLFTGDEERFKVKIYVDATGEVIWQGFILPDQYSEPYKNGCFFVSFTATDSLGRLKGKYLPEAYYSQEKSVIDIYCQILKLTGLELDLYFNPAIENFINRDWNTIYIDTLTFVSNKKKKTAYQILETLLKDTLCVCYQADNRWYIEGINTRHMRNVNYKVFTFNGVTNGTVAYTRLLKSIKATPTPTITMIPPYNEITVTHAKVEPSFPATLSNEKNEGWAIITGVIGEIHASDWMANNGLYANCIKPDYYVGLWNEYPSNIYYPIDNTKWISLKNKIFFAKGQKASFTFKFLIKKPGITDATPEDMNLWKNPFRYDFVFNNEIIYGNYNAGILTDQEQIIFSTSGTAELSIEHIFNTDGLFDVRLYRPFGATNTNRIEAIYLTDAKIEMLGFEEEEIITDTINAEFTIDKEVELTYGNDKSGFSKGFLLNKLKNQTNFYNEIEVPVLYVFPGDATKCVVQLKGANLIKENPYTVYKNGVLVAIESVVYNYENGEQMVVKTTTPNANGDIFIVKKYANDDVANSREHWVQWTDAVYAIENKTYPKTIVNIYRRLFKKAHEKIDLTVLNAVKFNDIVLFNYVYQKDFYPLNVSWNIDDNKTTLTLARGIYGDTDSIDGNLPPIVLAGDTIYLENAETTASLSATAYDPDGIIFSQLWTVLSGPSSIVIATPTALNSNLSNLIADYYKLQIEVTDNDGATGNDTIEIIRIKEYLITLDLINEVIESNVNYPSIDRTYKLNFTPELAVGMSVSVYGFLYMSALTSGTNGVGSGCQYIITKNTSVIETGEISNNTVTIHLTLNYMAGDVITIQIITNGQSGDYGSGDTGSASAGIDLSSVNVNSGYGTFTGLPISKTQQINV